MRKWKETCAKCADGEIEPTYCEYYGEPNGCNSPTYHAHPPAGNAAEMRAALEKIRKIASINIDECVGDYSDARVIEIADAALAAPARNCDKYTSESDAKRAFLDYRNWLLGSDYVLGCLKHNIDGITEEYAEWLLASAEKGGAESCER